MPTDITKPHQITTLNYIDLRDSIQALQMAMLTDMNDATAPIIAKVTAFLHDLKANAFDGITWVDLNAPKQ